MSSEWAKIIEEYMEVGYTEHGEIGHKVIGWPFYIMSPCGLDLSIGYEFPIDEIPKMRLCKKCWRDDV